MCRFKKGGCEGKERDSGENIWEGELQPLLATLNEVEMKKSTDDLRAEKCMR